MTGSGNWLADQFGNRVNGNPWTSTNRGKYIFVARAGNGLISSNIGLWNASTSEFLLSTNETQWIVEASADEDGPRSLSESLPEYAARLGGKS